jgi:hypothetical protein
MNQIFNRKTQAVCNEVKEVMRSSLMESGVTQENLADECMTTRILSIKANGRTRG